MHKDRPYRYKKKKGEAHKEFDRVVMKVARARDRQRSGELVQEPMRNPEARDKFGHLFKDVEYPRVASHDRLIDALALEVLNRRGMNRRKMFTQLTQVWGLVPSDAYAFLDAEYDNVRGRAKELKQLRDAPLVLE